ncbi:hypothetical protein BO94DRAFT_539764 [Aspergillus sclerotioniger CBS 115572]|uniref:Uncharacterized protein n=1 Tax=Aspergillus sclerotioniger CBS 115572 TaxID=1450535 RepID=A0A317VBD5_9EURO|nr:hypothetical protein BO94DRAFT_539764 [Aspergillus sclerotioniger CBS 115572]PWY70308.1 hypothetical protein BO94DRAFT_539764 [Aspergillus sclerotioniger CBS 115572]
MDETSTTAEGSNRIPLDNSGHGPLRVPGFGDIPIEYELPPKARFAHGIREWRQTPAVTARELAMVAVMNNLTDHPDWHVDIFNDEVVALWKKEAFDTTPLMSEKAWDWCLKELRDKAVYFRENQHIRVLDTGSCVCKSDTPTLRSLGAVFRWAVPPLLRQQKQQQGLDWRTKQLLKIVDPLLFPLVYGKSLVLTDGGRVDLHDIHGSYKHATVAPKQFDRRVDSPYVQSEIEKRPQNPMGTTPRDRLETKFYRWSWNYQCLPCEVEFLKDSGTEVRITSYINNIHPAHKGLYDAIEKLVSLAIRPWNDCLVQGQDGWRDVSNHGQLGPVPLRIITYGIEWDNELPEWATAFNVPSDVKKRMYRRYQERLQRSMEDQTKAGRKEHRKMQEMLASFWDVAGKEDMELPPPDSDLWQKAREYLELPEDGSTTLVALPDDWKSYPWRRLQQKVWRVLRWKHPEPGTAFSYEDWKTGRHDDRAIIDIVRDRPDWGLERPFHPVIPAHTPYMITLQDTFRKQGLQVIAEMDNIEVTPEDPSYSDDSWRLPGQLNEHIVAVAVFTYEVHNITEPRMAFRQHTCLEGSYYRYFEEEYTTRNYSPDANPAHRQGKTHGLEVDALEKILGFSPGQLSTDNYWGRSFQDAGSIATPQGRLVTFPNVREHRVEPFKLVDPTISGHYRSIKLYLVDPHYRVCSTRNVPPQQHHWWAQEVSSDLATAGLPREMIDEIMHRTNNWPMGMQEARNHRRELIKEHRWNERTKLGSMSSPGF